jgi:arylsulfatase A-like enzyme
MRRMSKSPQRRRRSVLPGVRCFGRPGPAWGIAALAAGAALAACGGGGPAGGPRFEPPLRLIAEAPSEAFEPASLHDEQVVFQLDLTTESEQARWRRSDGAGTGAIPRGVPVPAQGESWLLGSVEGIAECDVVEVDTTWVRRARLKLLVAAEEVPEGLGAGDPAPLSVAGRELFERPVGTRFRFQLPRGVLEPAADGGAPTVALRRIGGDFMKVRRLTCVRRSADPEAVAAALSKPWKVDLGGEVRFAVPARPGSPATFRATSPERAVLRFGYGVAAGAAGLRAVEVAAVLDGAGEGRVLFRSEEVPPEVWFDAEVDLGEYAGREATLELRAVAASEPPGDGAPAFFAHPVVVSAEPRGGARPPNVVLISVDTLRADHLELYGYGRRTMPNLTAWAEREAVVFENAVVQAPWTLPSHVSMLTGLDPLVHGVNYHHPAPEKLRMLPEILYERGYRTLAVTGGAYLDPQFGLDQGFERFRYYRGEGYEDELEKGLEVALQWLREETARARASGPFFLFFHTYDVHEPYYARDPYYGSFSGDGGDYPPVVTRGLPPRRELAFQARREMVFVGDGDGAAPDLERVRAMYDSGIAHTDRALARLLGELEALGVAEETIVVFTSDHGEALGEHGLAGHGDLYDHTVLVPLIVRLPGAEGAGERIAEQVRSVDILPTLLEALGIPAPEPIAGLSLLPLVRGARGLPEDAIVYEAIGNRGIAIRDREGRKYTLVDAAWKPTEAPTERIFDLASDPAELNGSTAESAELRRFRRQAHRLLRDTATGLHVRLWNQADEPLCGDLVGDVFRPNSVKVPAAESFTRWTGNGKVRLALPAGEQITLIVLDTGGAWLPLDFQPRGCGPGLEPAHRHLRFQPATIEVPLDDLSRPRWYRLEAGRWQPSPGGAGGADAVISLAWVGPAFTPRDGEGAAQVDGELEERLRALGYL